VYLLMSMLWGGHFTSAMYGVAGGGYEFGVFWAVMVAVFAALGGGTGYRRQHHTAPKRFSKPVAAARERAFCSSRWFGQPDRCARQAGFRFVAIRV